MSTIDPRMTMARAALIMHQPFFGTLALYLSLVERDEIETMATDGKSIFYCAPWLDTLTERQVEGVIAHEVMHVALLHHTRRGERDHKLWNVACDYAINRDILKAGFDLPEGGLIDKEGRYGEKGAEEIYDMLDAEKKKKGGGAGGASAGAPGGQEQPGQGIAQPGGAPGAGGGAQCPWGAVLDAAADHDKVGKSQAEEVWKTRIRQAIGIASASGKGAGSVPASVQRVIAEFLKPSLDWREMLRRFIDGGGARGDYSWMSPNKRMLGLGYIMPSLVPDGIRKLGVALDTSGSIDAKALSLFLAELQAALDEGNVEEVIVVHCDTQVHAVERFRQGDVMDVHPIGGGGTRFSPAIKWFEQNEHDVAALIYFTDLECGDYGDEPTMPVMWLAYEASERCRNAVPFGDVVDLDVNVQ